MNNINTSLNLEAFGLPRLLNEKKNGIRKEDTLPNGSFLNKLNSCKMDVKLNKKSYFFPAPGLDSVDRELKRIQNVFQSTK